MTLEEKIDLVLRKLNGSEGAQLGGAIQEWLPEGESNAVDNSLIIDLLSERQLIKPKGHNEHTITAKGRNVNDLGGWILSSRKQKWKRRIKLYLPYVFATVNIIVVVYALNQDKRIEREVDKLKVNQMELKRRIQEMLDSVAKIQLKTNAPPVRIDSAKPSK